MKVTGIMVVLGTSSNELDATNAVKSNICGLEKEEWVG